MIFIRLAGTALMVALVSTGLARPDLNAFLNRKATSVRELVRQVKTDEAVMDRFRRHFAMSDGEVIAYLANLRPARLTSSGVYAVYSVPPGGWIKLHYETLREGAPVYVDPAGVPVMLVKCGNPLGRGPKSPISTNEGEPEMSPSAQVLKEVDVAANTPASEDLIALVPSSPLMPPEEFLTIDQSPVTIIPGAFGFNPLLLGLGFLFLGNGGDDEVIQTVPEPSTWAVLGLGLAGVIRLHRHRSRPRRR